jgi:phosphoserine phosphatase RsbU/P
VIYSDGITEATNADDAEFGMDRLATVVRRALGGELVETCRGLLGAVQSFANRPEPQDDQTVMVLRFGAPRGGARSTAGSLETRAVEETVAPVLS